MRTKTLCDIVLYMLDIAVMYCLLVVHKRGDAEGIKDDLIDTKGIGNIL